MSAQPLLEAHAKEKEDTKIIMTETEAQQDLEAAKVLLSSSDVEIENEEVVEVHSSWLVIRWGRRTLLDPFLLILKRGLRPKQLATSAALGITLGVFPVCGMTVVLCVIAAAILRSNCNLPTLMLANLAATPLELGLIVPFLRLGELVCGGEHFLLTPNALWMVITGKANKDVLFGLLHALVGWAIMAPPIFGGLFAIFLPLFWYLVQKFGAKSSVHILTPVSPQIHVA